MNNIGKYSPEDRMIELINDDYRLLQVMSRFGLPLGFGDKSVKEVCEQHEVDTATFLAVVNFLQEDHELMQDNMTNISILSLVNYLKRAHSYFLDFSLPSIRQKLAEAIGKQIPEEIVFLILRFFDEYANEVREHMEFEDRYEFSYVYNLMEGEIQKAEEIIHQACPIQEHPTHLTNGKDIHVYQSGEKSNILLFSHKHALQHEQIDSKLTELKKILIKYYPSQSENLSLNATLFDIFNCEQDLAFHCRVEDYLFVPAVKNLEKVCGL